MNLATSHPAVISIGEDGLVHITLELSQLEQDKLVHCLHNPPEKYLHIDRIIEAVADHYKLQDHLILSKSRTKTVALARQVVMYMASIHTHKSLEEIGKALDNRSHSTVSYGIAKITMEMTMYPELREDVKAVQRLLFGT